MTRSSLGVILALVAACSPKTDDTSAPLPDDTGVPFRDTGNGFEPLDTGDVVLDEVPTHTLTIRQWGSSVLAPAGGPYTSLSGTLTVQEYLDGAVPDLDLDTDTDLDSDTGEPLECDLSYALAGVASERTCDGCTQVFDVQFSLLTGDREGCHDPFLPEHAETWTLAYHAADSTWMRDVGNSGTWFRWYDTTFEDDTLTYLWMATLGVAIEEEEM